MRILSWVQNKLNGKQEKNRFDVGCCSSRRTSISDDRKEEFSDWPQSLLAIGTLGNTDTKEETQGQNPNENSNSSEDQLDFYFSLEEVIKLQKEVTKLLSCKTKSNTDGSETVGERGNLQPNRSLNCPSSIEVDGRDSAKHTDELENEENNGDPSPNSKIAPSKARDILADKRNAIRRKSITLLLKKMFVVRSGLTPAPSLRDQLSETRMDKLMRILIHKKIHPQSSTVMLAKKYLKANAKAKLQHKEKTQEKDEGGCKWVKTDSDFIVLEM